MPSNTEFEETVEQIPQFIEDIGDEVIGDLSTSPNFSIGSDSSRGYWCKHGEHEYAIFSEPDREYFTIIYIKSIIANIAKSLDSQTVDELISEYSEEEIENHVERMEDTEFLSPEDIPDSVLRQANIDKDIEEIRKMDELPKEIQDLLVGGREILATKEILGSIESAQIKSIKNQLRERLAVPEVAFELMMEGNSVHGFHITRKVFLYEDTFSLQELNDSVQAVISIGVSGNNILANSYGELLPE